jgi:hypothetical protein
MKVFTAGVRNIKTLDAAVQKRQEAPCLNLFSVLPLPECGQ